MHIRSAHPSDLPILLELTIDTFGPFFESFRGTVGAAVFQNRHGNWRQDYAVQVAGLHDPDHGRYVAVAEDQGEIVGYVAWVLEAETRHGEIDLLAVSGNSRQQGVGRALAEHAIAAAKDSGVQAMSIGTGGDAFHAPARRLYEALGFTPFPNVSYTKAI